MDALLNPTLKMIECSFAVRGSNVVIATAEDELFCVKSLTVVLNEKGGVLVDDWVLGDRDKLCVYEHPLGYVVTISREGVIRCKTNETASHTIAEVCFAFETLQDYNTSMVQGESVLNVTEEMSSFRLSIMELKQSETT